MHQALRRHQAFGLLVAVAVVVFQPQALPCQQYRRLLWRLWATLGSGLSHVHLSCPFGKRLRRAVCFARAVQLAVALGSVALVVWSFFPRTESGRPAGRITPDKSACGPGSVESSPEPP